jgi:hypothetical protein
MHPLRPLYDWLALNTDARHIITDLLTEWQVLLDKKSARERAYHHFLTQHAGLFFSGYPHVGIVVSKLDLGTDLETDFVVGIDRNSVGFSYELIEIETPHFSPVTKDGNLSSRLTHAVCQILNWQYWLENNWLFAQQYFPHQRSVTEFRYSIYIGRRSDDARHNALRNLFSQRLGIEIRSFDHLTDRLRERVFVASPYIATEWDKLDERVQNQLMDPFFKAYTFGEWKKVKDLLTSHSHVVISNAESLLKFRKYNARREKFVQYWNSSRSGRPRP